MRNMTMPLTTTYLATFWRNADTRMTFLRRGMANMLLAARASRRQQLASSGSKIMAHHITQQRASSSRKRGSARKRRVAWRNKRAGVNQWQS